MNAYGYPIAKTHLISKTNGVIVEGLTSGGTNTGGIFANYANPIPKR
ncbi:hypothetical protein [Providencia huaxiensis]